ncbi:HTH-type transcriptional regulator MgrA [Symmachiella dynata]|uniref:MarR family winged helix-turn-helix transcriptional regulator n=1 Tax=Symmachiella dynata TaxID=2527995 RepID=UPI00118A389B|nr:MarR family transcriptional regulator [Symmachiella dynata]QDT51751.1 HTH-type transcriptional regulator MgrA [Symmachiella dynata]
MASKLQNEIKKRKPFDRLEEEATLNCLRTADYIQSRSGKLFRQFGLTSSQYNVLRILRGEAKPLPSLEIASRMIQQVPAITGLIDRLEKAEHVKRHRCEQDRRVVYVEITDTGLDVLKKIDEPLVELQTQFFAHMPRKDLRELIRLLEQVRSGAVEE